MESSSENFDSRRRLVRALSVGGVPKGSDTLGRVFTEGSPYVAGMTGAADSAAIVRHARGRAMGDTLAYVHLDKEAAQVRGSSGDVSISNGLRAFAARSLGSDAKLRPNGNASSTAPKSAAGLPALSFPTIKPPFESGNAFARPNGEVWVLRSRKAKDAVAVYDVFTATGGMIGRVALPPRTRLVGFGRTTLYAIRADDDDLQYLARWTLP